jgi:hypothetical protein
VFDLLTIFLIVQGKAWRQYGYDLTLLNKHRGQWQKARRVLELGLRSIDDGVRNFSTGFIDTTQKSASEHSVSLDGNRGASTETRVCWRVSWQNPFAND